MCLFLHNKSIIPARENEQPRGHDLLPKDFHSGCPFGVQTVLFWICVMQYYKDVST